MAVFKALRGDDFAKNAREGGRTVGSGSVATIIE